DRLTLLLDVIEVGEQPNGRMPEAVDDRGSLVHAGDQVRLGRVEGLDRDGEAVASGGVPRDPAGILELADRLLMIPTLGHGAGSTAPEYHDLASQRGCSREGRLDMACEGIGVDIGTDDLQRWREHDVPRLGGD